MSKRKTLGDIIRKARKETNISGRELARMIDINHNYLAQIERNEKTTCPEKHIKAMSKILEVDVDEMMAAADRFPDKLMRIYKHYPRRVRGLLEDFWDSERPDRMGMKKGK